MLRNWALGLGLVAFAMSLVAAGFGGGNPQSASSAYSSFAAAGFFRWAAIPLGSACFVLLVVAAVFHGLSWRGHSGV